MQVFESPESIISQIVAEVVEISLVESVCLFSFGAILSSHDLTFSPVPSSPRLDGGGPRVATLDCCCDANICVFIFFLARKRMTYFGCSLLVWYVWVGCSFNQARQ